MSNSEKSLVLAYCITNEEKCKVRSNNDLIRDDKTLISDRLGSMLV